MYGNKGGSETLLGEVLRGRRDQVVLATKFGHEAVDMGYGDLGPKGGRAYIRRAVDESLRRLRTDHVDLYQLHTPDPMTPIAETLTALDELVREGKVRYIGSSNFTGCPARRGRDTARQLGLSPRSSRRRTTGRCSSATSRTTPCRRPRPRASACCRSSRWPTDC